MVMSPPPRSTSVAPQGTGFDQAFITNVDTTNQALNTNVGGINQPLDTTDVVTGEGLHTTVDTGNQAIHASDGTTDQAHQSANDTTIEGAQAFDNTTIEASQASNTTGMDIDSIINHDGGFAPINTTTGGALPAVGRASLVAVGFDNDAIEASVTVGEVLNDLMDNIEGREATIDDAAVSPRSEDGGDNDYVDSDGNDNDNEDNVVMAEAPQEPQYSANPHTVKARKRNANLSGSAKFEEAARMADHKALGLARKKVMGKDEYKNATDAMKSIMLEQAMLEKKEERSRKGLDCKSKMEKYWAGQLTYRAGQAGPATLNPIPQFMARTGMAPPSRRPGPNRTIGERRLRNAAADKENRAPVADMGDGGDDDISVDSDVTITGSATSVFSNRRGPIKREENPLDIGNVPSILSSTHNRRPDQATTISLAREVDALRTVIQSVVNGLGNVRDDQSQTNQLVNTIRNDVSLQNAQLSLYKGQADTMMSQLPRLSNAVSGLEATVGFSNTAFNPRGRGTTQIIGGGARTANSGLLGDLERRVQDIEHTLAELRERIGQGDAVELRRASQILRGFAGVMNSEFTQINDQFGEEITDAD